jgi:hypothetical protein
MGWLKDVMYLEVHHEMYNTLMVEVLWIIDRIGANSGQINDYNTN